MHYGSQVFLYHLLYLFVCRVCGYTHAMTYVEVTEQCSGVILSFYHEGSRNEFRSLGLATGAFMCLLDMFLGIYNAHSYQEAFEEETLSAWRGFYLLAESRTLFSSLYQYILLVKITAVPQNCS